MKAQTQIWYVLAIAILVIGGGWTWWSRAPADAQLGLPPAPAVNHPAPDFELTTLHGEELRLSDLRGNVVILNFWASWCGPCRAEMPDLQAVHDRYSEQGLVVVGVNQLEPPGVAQSFAQSLNLDFPMPLDATGAVSQDYAVRSLPTTFFIDRNGAIRSIYVGLMNQAVIADQLRAIYP